eukprot:7964185-Alexandrium_andersonii.AAC.1
MRAAAEAKPCSLAKSLGPSACSLVQMTAFALGARPARSAPRPPLNEASALPSTLSLRRQSSV